MESNIIILFYSKYCKASLEIIDLMQECFEFKKICVDNKDIRHTILNESDKYNITEVPCIFIFYATGLIHKYEGQKAIDWVTEVRSNYMNSAKLLPPIKSSFQEIMPIQEIPSSHPEEKTTVVDSSSDDNPPYTGMKRHIETTPLIQQPSAEEENMRMDGNRNEKKITDKKNDSILNMAQSLQSQREKEDEALHVAMKIPMP